MKKTVYLISSIEIVVGAFILSICSIIKNIFSFLELGKKIYHTGVDTVTITEVSFPFATVISILLIIVGIGQIIISLSKKQNNFYEIGEVFEYEESDCRHSSHLLLNTFCVLGNEWRCDYRNIVVLLNYDNRI